MRTSAIGDEQGAHGCTDADFKLLYACHRDLVYGHCFRRVGTWAVAEDVTAATFLTAWRLRAKVPEAINEQLPWLLAVANNELRNTSRARARYSALVARAAQRGRLPEESADEVDARLDAERQLAQLRPIPRALPTRERDVIELYIGDQLTHAQAAIALGLPVGTVKSRLNRGLARIRTPATPDYGGLKEWMTMRETDLYPTVAPLSEALDARISAAIVQAVENDGLADPTDRPHLAGRMAAIGGVDSSRSASVDGIELGADGAAGTRGRSHVRLALAIAVACCAVVAIAIGAGIFVRAHTIPGLRHLHESTAPTPTWTLCGVAMMSRKRPQALTGPGMALTGRGFLPAPSRGPPSDYR